WYINRSAFCKPTVIGDPEATPTGVARIASGFGNSGVGIIRGPDQVNFDASLMKTTKITERQSLQFRVEFFNLANHPVFTLNAAPANSISNNLARNNANLFGVINATAGNPRLIQFALKYSF